MELERQVMMILVEVEVGTKFKTYSCRYIINNNVDRALEEANMYVEDNIIAGASPRPRSPLASPIHQNQQQQQSVRPRIIFQVLHSRC